MNLMVFKDSVLAGSLYIFVHAGSCASIVDCKKNETRRDEPPYGEDENEGNPLRRNQSPLSASYCQSISTVVDRSR